MTGLAAVLLGVAAVPLPPRRSTSATAGCCLAGAALAAIFLLSGSQTASLKLPLGLPGFGATLSLDPLCGVFLLPLLLAAGACVLGEPRPGHADPTAAPGEAASIPAALAAMLLALLAGDGFTLLLAAAAIPVAIALPRLVAASAIPTTPAPHAATAAIAAVVAAVCLAAVIGLLLAPGLLPGALFPAIRAHPPEGWRSTAVLGSALLGAVPLCVLLPTQPAPAPVAAAAPLAGLYILARLLLDLSGAATPPWWGVPLLGIGAAAATLGALRAATSPVLPAIVEGAIAGSTGLALCGLGVALLARGLDLPLLVGLAAGGVVLHVMTQGPLHAVLLLGTQAIGRGAGSLAIDRLGGLIQRMPATGGVLLLASACLVRLPLSAGFPGAWMIAQALLQAARISGLWLQMALGAALLALALGTALLAAASLRLVGTALLGRPRSPRGAAADDALALSRQTLLALAAWLALLGLAPAALLWLTAPAIAQLGLAVSADAVHQGAWTISPLHDGAGYAALPLALLLAAAAGLLAWAMRRRARAVSGAWEGGFAPPPPWLPFGDPATQLGADAISGPLRDAVNLPTLPRIALLSAVRGVTDHLDALEAALRARVMPALLALTLAGLCALLLDPR